MAQLLVEDIAEPLEHAGISSVAAGRISAASVLAYASNNSCGRDKAADSAARNATVLESPSPSCDLQQGSNSPRLPQGATGSAGWRTSSGSQDTVAQASSQDTANQQFDISDPGGIEEVLLVLDRIHSMQEGLLAKALACTAMTCWTWTRACCNTCKTRKCNKRMQAARGKPANSPTCWGCAGTASRVQPACNTCR